MSEKEQKRTFLLEEWKQNVALYIDQDKRAFQRIAVFVLMHAGLLTLYSNMFKEYFIIGCLIAVIGIYITYITKRMSNRAHAFILLRKLQAMLIEKKLRELSEGEKEWRTSSGIITTFTREHVAFQEHFGAKVPKEWEELKKEMNELDESGYAARPFKKDWKPSIGHLRWLNKMYNTVYSLWFLLVLVGFFREYEIIKFLKNNFQQYFFIYFLF